MSHSVFEFATGGFVEERKLENSYVWLIVTWSLGSLLLSPVLFLDCSEHSLGVAVVQKKIIYNTCRVEFVFSVTGHCCCCVVHALHCRDFGAVSVVRVITPTSLQLE